MQQFYIFLWLQASIFFIETWLWFADDQGNKDNEDNEGKGLLILVVSVIASTICVVSIDG